MLFTTFWNDLAYLNVYIFMALLATLLIDAILCERLGWSVLWASIILQIKPQWAFAVAVPLLLGRYRFFARLLVLIIVAYGVIAGGGLWLLVSPIACSNTLPILNFYPALTVMLTLGEDRKSLS